MDGFVYRRIDEVQYEVLQAYVLQKEVPYDIKTQGHAMMFGLPRYHWRRLEYAGAV